MGLRILSTNDDGWHRRLILSVQEVLTSAGHDVVLSAPKKQQSGAGGFLADAVKSDRQFTNEGFPGARDEEPEPATPFGCRNNNPRLNWVMSLPRTAARYGLDKFGPQFWGDQPCDLVVSGVNDNWNTGWDAGMSGTVNIAMYAATQRKIPSIAVSAQHLVNDPEMRQGYLYANLISMLVSELDKFRKPGQPLLPENVWLSIHMPSIGQELPKPSEFKWVLSFLDREHQPFYSCSELEPEDDTSLDTCDLDDLPCEQEVLCKGFKRISVSINREDFLDAKREDKEYVREALKGILAYSKL